MQSKKIILSLIAALAFTAGPATASDVYSVDTFAIGTLINGQFKVDSKEKAEACYKILNDETRRLEYILSAYDPDSDVTRLNQHPGEWIQIEPETFEVLNGSKTIAALTHGTFDPTVGALVKLWSVDQPEHRVPSEAEIKRALINVDYNLIDAKKENGRYFGKIGKKQSVAFGAIGKGYIADKVINKLKQGGCGDSLVSLGGNVIGSGTNGSDKPWSIGLQRPDKERGEYFAVVPLKDTSVVTSGDYEKFFIKDGVKYHHILNPKTGKPVPATLSSVTIIDDNSAKADALCTALFVMGWSGAIEYLQKHPDLKAVLLSDQRPQVGQEPRVAVGVSGAVRRQHRPHMGRAEKPAARHRHEHDDHRALDARHAPHAPALSDQFAVLVHV